MKKFYKDSMTAEEYNEKYKGKFMSEIAELEKKRFDENRSEIDRKHEDFVEESRQRMLTVGKLVKWLQEQDQNACILVYEPNSDAYIEQLDDLPNCDICTVAKAKKDMKDNLLNWYKDMPDKDAKAERDINTVFRYAKDADVILNFN